MVSGFHAQASAWPPHGGARPYVRWWWLNGPFREPDIRSQLAWFADMGFGGVEIAWLEPLWLRGLVVDRPRWLGEEWSRLVTVAKQEAEALGLGCDFTLGSVWPFGGSCVTEEIASREVDGLSGQRIFASWESPAEVRVLDHLSSKALDVYVDWFAAPLADALQGVPSALFCDSLEISVERMWSEELWRLFEERHGYSLRDHVDDLPSDPGVRHDHRKVVGEAIVREFYAPFTEHCHRLGAVSRVQCHGAPGDLLSAYAVVDVPESEALLFPPAFSRIPASAAAIAGRGVVSCETFTCIYGFPRGKHVAAAVGAWKKERVEDLKLLADAVFANGVNQIVWHGAPYNGPGGENEFYASVHVGPDSPLTPHLPAFNAYLTAVGALLQDGRPVSGLGVYLPNEDMVVAGDLTEELWTPGAALHSEMRDVVVPDAARGYAPLWLSGPFLREARVEGDRLCVGELRVPALLVDVEWLDSEALDALLRLSAEGLALAVVRRPRCPGRLPDPGFDRKVDALLGMPGVVRRLDDLPAEPLVEAEDLPWFWARETDDALLLFVAHPAVREIRYPMTPGWSELTQAVSRHLRVRAFGSVRDVVLDLGPCESKVLRVSREGIEEVPLPSWRARDDEAR